MGLSPGSSSKRSLKLILTLATFTVWTAVLGLAGWKYQLGATLLSVRVHLTSVPGTVRIQVNGQMFNDGAWIKTPTTISVPAGRSRIRIMRDGYASQLVTVTGFPGSEFTMDSVILGPKPDVEFVTVEIDAVTGAPENLSFGVDLNRGFVEGGLPLSLSDLEAGKEYVLQLRWTLESSRRREMRCRFTTTPESLTLRPVWHQGRVRIEGCRNMPSEKNPP
jgi:hypothetical protein